MSKSKNLNRCPVCGSRNIQLEGQSSKGKLIYCCCECDEIFEIYGKSKDMKNQRNRKERDEYSE